MEEKDVQIKGYKIRLAVDVVFRGGANPEDYTSRRPHHHAAEKIAFNIQISHALSQRRRARDRDMSRKPHPPRSGVDVRIPQFMKESSAQITFEARASNEINQIVGRVGARDDQQFRIGDLQRREARRGKLGERDRSRGFRICIRCMPRRGKDELDTSARTRRRRPDSSG